MPKTLVAIAKESGGEQLKILLPFSHRLNCFIRLWVLKSAAYVSYALARRLHPPPASQHPTLIKYYPCRPGLQTRIFFPPDYKSGDLLPLYLSIHGGGFVVGDPQSDDEFCTMWAKRTGMLVVSLNYYKAPISTFPTPVYDVAALADAVLKDSELPIDTSKIAIGGFSAGGNLALTASQLPELKGRVKAALIFYPTVDFSHPPDVKLETRPYKGAPKDILESMSWWFDWAYVASGVNRRNPILSPCYAKTEDLPPWIYVIGAQWDMLRLEAQDMIHDFAGLQDVEDQEADFEKGTYKWTLVKGTSHGFTHHFGQTAAKRKRREQKCEPVWQQAHEWLNRALDAELKVKSRL